ncbi:hypothetical protein DSECCO2_338470 [anaerobic digester metagenome]
MNGPHQAAEGFPVFRLMDRLEIRSQNPDVEFFQDSVPGQLHGQVQARLSAQGRQYGTGPLPDQDSFQKIQGQRLHIDAIGGFPVRHDGGGIGIDQDDIDALFTQRFAGLSSGVVKLRRLADDDWSRTDDQHFLDCFID